MKSLIQYVKESFKLKYNDKTPEELITIFADDINRIYDNPDNLSKQQFGILGHFVMNFSHNNIVKKHFKVHKYNIPLRRITDTSDAPEKIINDAEKHNIDNVRYLFAFLPVDGTSYKTVCIDLRKYEFCSVMVNTGHKPVKGFVHTGSFKPEQKISDIKSATNFNNWLKFSGVKYVIISDEYYR